MSSAYLLVSHGSRDRRPEIAMQQLAKLVHNKLSENHNALNSVHQVGIAALEMNPQPLHQQIQEFANRAFCERQPSQNQNRLKIVPLFLLPGVHVMTDIPGEVALAQQAIGQDIMIELQPYLGSHPNLDKLLAKQIAAIKTEAWILLAHGSRRPGSKETVEAMAASLGIVAAYWANPPSLESRVKELVAAGYKEIAILPYFLFAGGITDAIAASIEELKLQFPAVNFQLAEPLGASAELAELIWDLTDR
ncbi:MULTISPECIES: sirohydrochlorin chelatase [unclassified Nostoc]|uniref:sirohydrochlorin chelatase n=1 Tax=unclassified Nostoc TaxID=2593658 RepID=UPI002AD3E245|nr:MULTISPECIES: sirohydrochlorin chelatase [unclassified Nostoc]MDZ8122657.1 sirohydrochlorin chelatase [Nostoc sp. CmiVER01]MDZ8227725.1 sirohydrochlorin chelatase [Nostoc sp. ChiVER01]